MPKYIYSIKFTDSEDTKVNFTINVKDISSVSLWEQEERGNSNAIYLGVNYKFGGSDEIVYMSNCTTNSQAYDKMKKYYDDIIVLMQSLHDSA